MSTRLPIRTLSPGAVEWKHIHLQISINLQPLEGVRLLHLSDLHLTHRWFESYDRLLAEIAVAQVDLIAITGDLIDNRWNPTPATLRNTNRFLAGLKSRLGTYVILGNHDGDLLAPYIDPRTANLLHPGMATIDYDGAVLQLAGLPGVHRRDLTACVIRRFATKPANTYRVVLAHYPDQVLKLGGMGADLMLAGHTHGGQVCMPGGRPIITHDGLPKAMSSGVHRVGGCDMVVSRGVGFATYPIRLFSPPEAMVITLQARINGA